VAALFEDQKGPSTVPWSRTGIYQHSRRDLIHATRKIKRANEPVVHDKHQPAAAMLALPNICAKACNPVAMTFFFGNQR